MEKFDLGLAFVWEYDQDFIDLTERLFHQNNLTTFIIGEHNIAEVRELIQSKKLHFNFYLDRAWDVNEEFGALGLMINKRKTVIFNPYKQVLHAIDKATMHLEFISSGIHVPHSIIIPPVTEKEELYISLVDLAKLGRPFIIKPCNTTGGGTGVVTGAESLQEILHERNSHSEDKYIIQEKIYPMIPDGKRAWFRVFWAFGNAVPTWWDDQTHLYREMTQEEVRKFNLKEIFSITKTIAKLTQLDFFSTEIVLTQDGRFLAIDYVNDQCDMRLQSLHYDGVPDRVASQISYNMMKKVKLLKRKFKI